MSRIFVGRKEELRALEERYRLKTAQFMVIYGRRRVGKTELIKHFVKGKDGVYYLCTKEALNVQLQRIAVMVAETFQQPTPLVKDVDDLGKYIQSVSKEKLFVLAIDEFPFMIGGDKATPSVWQRLWDEYLSKFPIFVILCGSSISMMESEVLGSKSPLYGRRTGQIKLQPLRFPEVREFYSKKKIEEVVYLFSVTDGIPFYMNEMNPDLSFLDNIKINIASKDKLLYEEPDLLLREELREPHLYKEILKAIAKGCTKLTDICNTSGIPQNQITKYLNVLIELNFIEKRSPITIKKAISKQTLYFIKDNFFLFYFKFIESNKYLVEQDKQDEIINKIGKELDQYIGKYVFERVAKEIIQSKGFSGKLPLKFTKIGSWWSRKGDEIDIVLLNEETSEIMFCEVKWSTLSQQEVHAAKNNLKEKAALVDWNNKKRKEYFAIFAKGFKEKKKESEILLYNLHNF